MKKRVIAIIASIILIVTGIYAFYTIKSYADDSTKIYVNLKKTNKNTSTGVGYALGNVTNGVTVYSNHIWNIKTYTSAATNSSETDPQRNLYCIKGNYSNSWNTGSGTDTKVTYNNSFDLQSQRSELISFLNSHETSDTTVSSLLSGTKYKSLLWLLDHVYTGKTTKEEYINNMLDATYQSNTLVYNEGNVFGFANRSVTRNLSTMLTDDDIKAIERAAIWYFTNSGDSAFNKLGATTIDSPTQTDIQNNWLTITTNGGSRYDHLQDVSPSRGSLSALLYYALIQKATTGASDYNSNYQLADGSGNKKTIWLSVDSSTGKLNGEQPLVEVEPGKDFDLALRKYITKVETGNGTTVSIDTRKPNITESTISGSTHTATYKHRKDPVKVMNGYFVYYNLTVYNEGEADGHATQITDMLPAGLEYVSLESSKFERDSTNSTTTKLVLKRKSGVATQKAYESTKLETYSETVTVKCKVTNAAQVDKIYTNIAWISGYHNSYINTDVTKDIDSDTNQPLTPIPSLVTTDVGYTGRTTYTQVSQINSSSTYYKGQEDDDDFEKIQVIAEPEIHKGVKRIKNQDSGYNGSDTHTWVIQSDIPTNITDYSQYTITDDIDYRLAFSGVTTVSACIVDTDGTTVLDNTLVRGTDFVVSYSSNSSTTNSPILGEKYSGRLIVTFRKDGTMSAFSSKVRSKAGKKIQIKFNTKFNQQNGAIPEDVMGKNIPNRARLEYKNVATPELIPIDTEIPEVHTGGVVLYKVDDSNNPLEGAEFSIYSSLAEANNGQNALQTVESDENGLVKFIGLEYGGDADATPSNLQNGIYKQTTIPSKTYYAKEKKAPAGYNANTSVITVTINASSYVTSVANIPSTYKVSNTQQKFDLALRKYITGVKRNNVSVNNIPNTRVLTSIDASKLNTTDSTTGELITTATYKHRKDPIVVEENDVVTYSIRIYNEGEKAGYAKVVIDQLPTGLILNNGSVTSITSRKGNVYSIGYTGKASTNRVTLTSSTGKNINPYTSGTPDYDEITLSCLVDPDAGLSSANQDSILTNVAWISKEYDAVAKVDITKKGPTFDRDSAAETGPKSGTSNVSKSNITNYKGNTDNKSDLTDSNYHYKGQEDDDDFEKVKVEAKSFDLALRKYIKEVKRDNTVLSNIQNARNLTNIDTSKLNTIDSTTGLPITTATYKHRKDPIIVQTNDIVTYSIRIYNEGEKAGYAKTIVDQLPTGLILNNDTNTTITSSKGNVYSITYTGKSSTNRVTLTSSTGKNINAYTSGNLDYDEILLSCKVEAEPNNALNSNTILTNVAWISKEYDAVAKKDIDTDQVGDDRDSAPGALPKSGTSNITKSNIANYKGHSDNKSTLTDSTYHYKGQEDDDDFEKVVVESKVFDLALRKYISKVETASGTDVPISNPRNPLIDESTIAGNPPTATYNHKKDPVKVKKGYYVYYDLSIYNEGEVDGYASQITDVLPAGLEYVSLESSKFEKDATNSTATKLVLKRKSGVETQKAYTANKLNEYSETVRIKFKVTDSAQEDNILTNIAWISGYYDSFRKKAMTKDIDSYPTQPLTTLPDLVTTDVGYTGEDTYTKAQLNNSNNYFKGQEDDDDFEKIEIITEPNIHKGVKTIVNQDSGYNGDEQHLWVIHSDIPKDITDYTQYTITDDIDSRLTFSGTGNVVVKILNADKSVYKTLTNNTDYKLQYTANSSTTNSPILGEKYSGRLIVTFRKDGTMNAFSTEMKKTANAGKIIQITYKTTFTNPTEILGQNIPNRAELEFKNSAEPTLVKKLTEIPEVHTGGVTLYKYTQSGTTKNPLAGAKFAIYGSEADANNGQNPIQTVTTGSDGLVKFTGLQYGGDASSSESNKKSDGTYVQGTVENRSIPYKYYWVKETQAPNNYKLLTNVTRVKVDATSYKTTAANVLTANQIPNEPKEFDLALRKFITKIGNTELTGDNSREPEVIGWEGTDGTKLDSGKTLIKTHAKNQLKVNTGDKVVYTIRVYNEGEIDGTATEVKDYLPEGLEFVNPSESTINTNNGWSADSTGKVITTTKLNNQTIKAFDSSKPISNTTGSLNPDYKDLQIECRVTAQVKANNLKNIAAITNDNGSDRDSQPETLPNRNNYNPEAPTNGKGEQDDDDFEDLLLDEKISIPVEKVWNDNNNQDGIRPTTLRVKLYANNVYANKYVDLKQSNNWKQTFANLSKYDDNGNVITYKVVETVPTGYTRVSTTGNQNNGFVITNRYNPGKTSVTVIKIWDDANNQDGKRPTSISVTLLADGVAVEGKTVDLNEANSWTYTFEDLDAKKNGVDIVYTIRENTTIPGYTTTITPVDNSDVEGAEPEFEITNKHTPELTEFTVNKVWSDDNNIDNSRPTSVRVYLYADGVYTKKYIDLKESNNWTHTFTNLAKYNNGTLIKYTVKEKSIPEYTPTYKKNSDYNYTVTNKYKAKDFDLALRKYITKVERGTEVVDITDYKRTNSDNKINVDTSKLNTEQSGNLVTTADYNHRKDPIKVRDGDNVTYNLAIFNEGEKAGYAKVVIDQLPNDLTYVKDTGTDNLITSSKGNKYLVEYTASTNTLKLTIQTVANNIEPYSDTLDSEIIEFRCKVTPRTGEGITKQEKMKRVLTNIAWIDVAYDDVSKRDVTDQVGDDRDSEPKTHPDKTSEQLKTKDIGYTGKDTYTTEQQLSNNDKYYKGQQDEDDFEKVYVEKLDLSLRKFISGVNGEELKDNNNKYEREPDVDTTPLKNNTDTTAIYKHPKKPLAVKPGDTIIYTLRVYNEGDVNGTANQVKDYLPPELEFVANSEINNRYGWQISENGRVATTSYLSDKEIAKYNGGNSLDYKDIQIECKLKDDADVHKNITNIAEISQYKFDETVVPEDIDSESDDIVKPEDKDLPDYQKDKENDEYVPGQEDDDDFEKVIIKEFDLALRKFITKIQDEEITSRIPQPKIENGNIKYEHPKDPITLHVDDVVIYTLRIYNEGELPGYASKISDDIPEHLEYLPNHSINNEYLWKMIDKDGNETDDVRKATRLETDYLSKEQGEERMKKDSSLTDNPSFLKEFDGNTLFNRDIQIAFKVKDPQSNTTIITNHAQISDDTDENGKPIKDKDSEPDEWNEGEDDQDIENVKVEYFDLSLLKFVSKVIVIEDGKQQVTQTGYNGHEDPEPVVKVDLHRKKLDKVTVKFGYGITITNEGDIPGFAKEITDYVPQGLKFVQADNPDWKDEGNNVISTRQLEGKLLHPGESATVEVILTWINGADNLATKTNTAEISEDDNPYKVPDRDSTPDNKREGEDDIDIAKVILAVATGSSKTYFLLTLGLLSTVGVGIIFIKKYVI